MKTTLFLSLAIAVLIAFVVMDVRNTRLNDTDLKAVYTMIKDAGYSEMTALNAATSCRKGDTVTHTSTQHEATQINCGEASEGMNLTLYQFDGGNIGGAIHPPMTTEASMESTLLKVVSAHVNASITAAVMEHARSEGHDSVVSIKSTTSEE